MRWFEIDKAWRRGGGIPDIGGIRSLRIRSGNVLCETRMYVLKVSKERSWIWKIEPWTTLKEGHHSAWHAITGIGNRYTNQARLRWLLRLPHRGLISIKKWQKNGRKRINKNHCFSLFQALYNLPMAFLALKLLVGVFFLFFFFKCNPLYFSAFQQTKAADLQSNPKEAWRDYYGKDRDPCNYIGSKFIPGQGRKLCEHLHNGWKRLPDPIKARCPNARSPECKNRKCSVDIDRKSYKRCFGPVQSVRISHCVKKEDVDKIR